ncbi:unnamed protein product [Enterobius vermicularis]|uniref:DUF1624 domain-containing protein n=1 Tax=Enterobius vermicularis TaxID=51028 RepID=A0A0N4UTY4_ENTVE|nr:unnamed protein product [Enterobius vermicularis]
MRDIQGLRGLAIIYVLIFHLEQLFKATVFLFFFHEKHKQLRLLSSYLVSCC